MNQLRPYQVKGVEHLLSSPFGRPHALLADAPGTGKTIMTIEAAKQSNCKTGVILCPAIIKEQWRRQMVAWNLCAEDEIQVLYGLDAKVDKRPWVVLNYDLVRESEIAKQLRARKWNVLAMDEAHRLKTHTSQQTHAVFHKSYGIANVAYYKWALSGSIMPNRPAELYPLLKTMCPEVIKPYDNWTDYISRYCGGAYNAGRGASNIPELTERIQPFMLCRALEDVWKECPQLIENVTWLDVPYESHPEWQGSGFMQEATERRIVAEAKIPHTVAYLKQRLEDGAGKIVVFTYHRATIDRMMVALAKYNPAKIYGGMSLKKREENFDRFIQNPDCALFFIQIASGGEGLDGLQHVAREYVEAEPEWSPGREDQAGRRILRLGQTRTVISTLLLAANSYEERIYRSNQRKRKIIDVVLKPNGGEFFMPIEASLEKIATTLSKFDPLIDLVVPIVVKALQDQPQIMQSFAPPVQQFAPQQFAVPQQRVAAPLPAPTPQPAPVVQQQAVPGAPSLPPETAAFATNVPAAPSATAPVSVQGGMTPEQFAKYVINSQQPKGQEGFDKIKSTMKLYGVEQLTAIPESAHGAFLNALNA